MFLLLRGQPKPGARTGASISVGGRNHAQEPPLQGLGSGLPPLQIPQAAVAHTAFKSAACLRGFAELPALELRSSAIARPLLVITRPLDVTSSLVSSLADARSFGQGHPGAKPPVAALSGLSLPQLPPRHHRLPANPGVLRCPVVDTESNVLHSIMRLADVSAIPPHSQLDHPTRSPASHPLPTSCTPLCIPSCTPSCRFLRTTCSSILAAAMAR